VAPRCSRWYALWADSHGVDALVAARALRRPAGTVGLLFARTACRTSLPWPRAMVSALGDARWWALRLGHPLEPPTAHNPSGKPSTRSRVACCCSIRALGAIALRPSLYGCAGCRDAAARVLLSCGEIGDTRI